MVISLVSPQTALGCDVSCNNLFLKLNTGEFSFPLLKIKKEEKALKLRRKL